MTATTPAKAPRTRKTNLKPCRCRSFEVGTEYTNSNGQPDRTAETTGCDRQTHRLFAQGHDAKLVSFLVQAELDGLTIWLNERGILSTYTSAETAALSVSEALGTKAANALRLAQAKAEARKTRQAVKAARRVEKATTRAAGATGAASDGPVGIDAPPTTPEAPEGTETAEAAATRSARIKIGRWEYNAMITTGDGTAHYATKLGGPKTAKLGDYAEV